MEESIGIPLGDIRLDGRLHMTSGRRGAVLTHPHPLYGGDMFNPVVEAMADAYHRAGYTTLRFNFRGVGKSGGTFGDGIGEQDDVRAALAHLADRGLEVFALAGYSFGTWVNAHVEVFPVPIVHQIMVSPPVAFMPFSSGLSVPTLGLVVTGSEDAYAPPAAVRAQAETWAPRAQISIIDGADHFYWGYHRDLETILDSFLSRTKNTDEH